MQSIGFDKFYGQLQDEIDTAKVKAKISKLSVKNKEAVAHVLGNEGNSKIKSMYIDYKGEKLGQSGPKDAYTEFFKKLCENPDVFKLLMVLLIEKAVRQIMLPLTGMGTIFIRTVIMI